MQNSKTFMYVIDVNNDKIKYEFENSDMAFDKAKEIMALNKDDRIHIFPNITEKEMEKEYGYLYFL